MDSIPQMRSGYFKHGVKALESLATADRERIFSSVAAETLQAIQQDVDIGWVPLRLNADFTEVVYRVLGPDGTRAYGRRVGNSSFDTPILRSLMEATIRLLGIGPKGLFKVTRRSWNAVYRNCGEVEVDARAENAVRIRLVGAPELMLARSYVDSVSGGLEAIFDFCKMRGTVKGEPRAGQVEWLAQW